MDAGERIVPSGGSSSLPAIPGHKYMYGWQFGNLNWPAMQDMMALLKDEPHVVLLVNENGVKENGPWEQWKGQIVKVPSQGVKEFERDPEAWLQWAKLLAERMHGAVFLFAAGPLATALIPTMHVANPHNTYIDTGGSLDLFVTGRKSRDWHIDWVKSGGATTRNQKCHRARWPLPMDGVFDHVSLP